MHRLTLPGWAASVLLALASAPANAQPTAIVINEINYNSGDDAPSDDWVELHNPTAVAVDLSGWSFADESGRPFAMPPNTSIPARGFLVLAENTADFKLVYPEVTVLVGDFGAGDAGFGLSGGGEKLTLTDAAGAVIDEVTYADQAP